MSAPRSVHNGDSAPTSGRKKIRLGSVKVVVAHELAGGLGDGTGQ
jgi:hypothetical protein